MIDGAEYLHLQEQHGGKFVAFNKDDEVVASAKTYGELVRALEESGVDREAVVFEHVRPKDRVCAY